MRDEKISPAGDKTVAPGFYRITGLISLLVFCALWKSADTAFFAFAGLLGIIVTLSLYVLFGNLVEGWLYSLTELWNRRRGIPNISAPVSDDDLPEDPREPDAPKPAPLSPGPVLSGSAAKHFGNNARRNESAAGR